MITVTNDTSDDETTEGFNGTRAVLSFLSVNTTVIGALALCRDLAKSSEIIQNLAECCTIFYNLA